MNVGFQHMRCNPNSLINKNRFNLLVKFQDTFGRPSNSLSPLQGEGKGEGPVGSLQPFYVFFEDSSLKSYIYFGLKCLWNTNESLFT